MWSPTSVINKSRIVGRSLWPLTRRFSTPRNVVSRSFGKKDCLVDDKPKPKEVEICPTKCNKQAAVCPPKPKPCPKKPCVPPCHACPANDPCWHCPYIPPPCPRFRRGCPPPCCDNPYAYKVRTLMTSRPTAKTKKDEDRCGRIKCKTDKCEDGKKCEMICSKLAKPVKKTPCKRENLKCFTTFKPPTFNPKCPRPEDQCEVDDWKPEKIMEPELCKKKPLKKLSVNKPNKDTCCPPKDNCKKESRCNPCEPPQPEPRRKTRCERPGADLDPCCSRTPKCPDPCAKGPSKDECERDCPERPRMPDPCQIDGEICAEEPCEFKKPEKCCSENPSRDIKCCPRRQKPKKKREIKKTCCLDLDPNWPPKRPQCACDFPPKEPGPCQQAAVQSNEFWDGLH